MAIMVPSDFAPSVQAQPTQPMPTRRPWAPQVEPMGSTGAAGQLEEAGATAEAYGNQLLRQGQSIKDAIQNQIDDATARNAETQALQQTQDLLNGDNGYLRTQGLDAVNGFDPTKDKLAQIWQDAAGNLTNPIQQRMFDQVKAAHLMNFGAQMVDHSKTQSTQYALQAHKDRAESYSIQALNAYPGRNQTDENGKPTGNFYAATQTMEDEINHVAAIQGAAPDSEQAQAMRRAAWSKLNSSIIAKLVANGDTDGAKKWFDGQVAADHMTQEDIQKYGDFLDTEHVRQVTESSASNTLKAAAAGIATPPVTVAPIFNGGYGAFPITSTPTDTRDNGTRQHDGYDFAVPVNTDLLAPADAKVVKVWNDTQFGGGLSVRLQLPNGYTMGMAHLSKTNVAEGDTIKQGQVIALSGQTGNATGPTVHLMAMDPDGKYVNPMTISQPQPAAKSIGDPEVLQKAIDAVNANDQYSDTMKQGIIESMRQQSDQQRSLDNQLYEDVKKQAADAYVQNNGKVPTNILMQLRPADAYAYTQPPPKKNDPDVYFSLATKPDLTLDDVNKARPYLTDDTWVALGREAMVRQKQQAALGDVNVDMQQVNRSLLANGMAQYVSPKKGSSQSEAAANLYMGIMQTMRAQQVAAKRPLNQDEKQKIIDDAILAKVPEWSGWFGGVTNVPMWSVTQQNDAKAFVSVGGRDVPYTPMPADVQRLLVSDMASQGKSTDPASVYAEWVKRGKPQISSVSADTSGTGWLPSWLHVAAPSRYHSWDVDPRELDQWDQMIHPDPNKKISSY